jgi:hypothetical protein
MSHGNLLPDYLRIYRNHSISLAAVETMSLNNLRINQWRSTSGETGDGQIWFSCVYSLCLQNATNSWQNTLFVLHLVYRYENVLLDCEKTVFHFYKRDVNPAL